VTTTREPFAQARRCALPPSQFSQLFSLSLILTASVSQHVFAACLINTASAVCLLPALSETHFFTSSVGLNRPTHGWNYSLRRTLRFDSSQTNDLKIMARSPFRGRPRIQPSDRPNNLRNSSPSRQERSRRRLNRRFWHKRQKVPGFRCRAGISALSLWRTLLKTVTACSKGPTYPMTLQDSLRSQTKPPSILDLAKRPASSSTTEAAPKTGASSSCKHGR